MTREEFIITAADYDSQTAVHSFAHMNRKTEAYKRLMSAGRVILPWIIEGLEAHEKNYHSELALSYDLWGMHWVVVLMDITGGYTPIEPVSVCGGKMQAWSVDDTCRAWIKWYRDAKPLG